MSGGSGGSKESAQSGKYYEQMAGIAREQFDIYKEHGIPALEKLTGFEERKPSDAEYAAAAGQAGADVDVAYDRAGAELKSNLSRYGVNPSSGRFAGANRALALDRAGSKAGARTGSRIDTKHGVATDEMRRYGRLSGTYGTVAGIPGAAAAGLSAAAGGLGQIGAQKRQSRAGGLRGLGRLAGGAAGFYFGGPAGAAAGAGMFG